MNAFLTGATGFVGGYLAQVLAARGYGLRLLVRQPTRVWENLKPTYIVGDLSDTGLLREAIQGCDVVVHAAAKVSFWKKDQEALYQTNVVGTANLVNMALDAGVSRLLYVSSIAAIGRPSTAEQPLDETAQWSDEDAPHAYAQTKHEGEREVWRGMAEGLDALIVNPSLVLGVGDWKRSSLQVLDYIARKNQFHPTGTVNYVDVRDVAQMSIDLLEGGHTGRYIQSAGAMPYGEFFAAFAQRVQQVRQSQPLPPWMGELAWRWEALRSLLTQKPPQVTPQALRSARGHQVYDSQKIQKTLGRNFRSLEQTLDWIADHYPRQ
ncbi:MAG: NAD-dependent epimerase/dehydratase family protein [Bernardetiaceae bacterium]